VARSRLMKRTPVRAAALAALLVAGLLSALPLAAPAATSVTFTPTDDTFAHSSLPSTTHGSLTEFRVDGSPVLNGYLRFDVAGLTAPVTRAVLRVYSRTSHAEGFEVRAVSTLWDEETLTWSNAPVPSSTVAGRSGSIAAGTWAQVDVTTLVAGNGPVAFALATTSATNLPLGAKEGGNAPQLVVETGASSSGTSTSAPITTAPTTTSPTTTTVPTTPGEDPVIGAAGDIACQPPYKVGASTCHHQATADLLADVDAVLPLGDLQYEDGRLSYFQKSYDPTWGAHFDKTYPAVGNHEYLTSGAAGYYDYFGSRAGPRGKGYYSFKLGEWRLYAINSMCSTVGGCGPTSAQYRWLQAELEASTEACELAYWHHPRWSAGPHGDDTGKAAIVSLLDAHGADVVLAGHDHSYQRFAPMNGAGEHDPAGIRSWVVGTGGKNFTAVGSRANLVVWNSSTYGVLKLTLRPASYDWRFVPEPGKTFTDVGTGPCH
jgi:hypothetical protein